MLVYPPEVGVSGDWSEVEVECCQTRFTFRSMTRQTAESRDGLRLLAHNNSLS